MKVYETAFVDMNRVLREQVVSIERHWVRLTYSCNNHCIFCLDSEVHEKSNVPIRPQVEIVADIEAGRKLGKTHLILSGGEPSIHPDFMWFIEEGRRQGYERIQVITNGRIFARSELLEEAIDAGLGELTISVHGHHPKIHDEIVGVPGAFLHTLAAIRNGVEQRLRCGLIVNVDIVVCGLNVESIDKIIALCQKMGINEFDLLQVQPSGRAVQNRHHVFYDIDKAQISLKRVFSEAKKQNIFLWTNRFPIEYLEGYEELIQDPRKLKDEVHGRYEHFEALFSKNKKMRCQGSLCDLCFLSPFCEEFYLYCQKLFDNSFSEILFDMGQKNHGASFFGNRDTKINGIRVVAFQASDLRRIDPSFFGNGKISFWIEGRKSLRFLKELFNELNFRFGMKKFFRFASNNPEVLDEFLDLSVPVEEIEVTPSRATQNWMLKNLTLASPQLVLRAGPLESLSEARENEIHPKELNEILADSNAIVEDFPICLSGDRPVRWSELQLLPGVKKPCTPEGLNIFVQHFISQRYRAKSLSCRNCGDNPKCRGQLVQRIRAFGLKILRPRPKKR